MSPVDATVDFSDLFSGSPNARTPMLLRQRRAALDTDTVARIDRTAASGWPDELVNALMVGAGYELDPSGSAAGLQFVQRRSIADTVGPDMRLLVVGLNPSPLAADVGIGFARPGNRFWPAAISAGIVMLDRDPEAALRDCGVGMTDIVKRTTVGAKELTTREYATGLDRLSRLSTWLRPGVVCVVGLTGWRAVMDRSAVAGHQPDVLGGCPVYLMPNPSGLNAHVTMEDFADHFRAASALANRDNLPGRHD